VLVAAVPWAAPGSRFTTFLEDTMAWQAAHAPFSTVTRLLRVTWRTVQQIVTRAVTVRAAGIDRLDGLERIGIDEIAYRKGHRYLTIVVDDATGTIVWAAEGRNSAVVHAFFDALGDRAADLMHVTTDAAEWIHTPVRERAPRALICLGPFHLVKWATDALDALRRGTAADLRRRGHTGPAAALQGTRWILIRNPGDLSDPQRTTLAGLQHTSKRLYRAYLIKEQLRAVFTARTDGGRALPAGLIAWCRRCRIPEFVKLGAAQPATSH
jgi:transposase